MSSKQTNNKTRIQYWEVTPAQFNKIAEECEAKTPPIPVILPDTNNLITQSAGMADNDCNFYYMSLYDPETKKYRTARLIGACFKTASYPKPIFNKEDKKGLKSIPDEVMDVANQGPPKHFNTMVECKRYDNDEDLKQSVSDSLENDPLFKALPMEHQAKKLNALVKFEQEAHQFSIAQIHIFNAFVECFNKANFEWLDSNIQYTMQKDGGLSPHLQVTRSWTPDEKAQLKSDDIKKYNEILANGGLIDLEHSNAWLRNRLKWNNGGPKELIETSFYDVTSVNANGRPNLAVARTTTADTKEKLRPLDYLNFRNYLTPGSFCSSNKVEYRFCTSSQGPSLQAYWYSSAVRPAVRKVMDNLGQLDDETADMMADMAFGEPTPVVESINTNADSTSNTENVLADDMSSLLAEINENE
jgi:hypothetical protein